MDFTSIDVETANADLASVCQIGVVRFRSGKVSDIWQTLLNPEDCFDRVNVSVHGIDEDLVADAPTFPSVSGLLSAHLSGSVVVSHTAFDRVAIDRMFARYGLQAPKITWLDTARVVRRAWPDCSRRGYALASVADKLGIAFQHHNAAEDARAAGEVLIHAIRATGLSLQDWMERVRRPVHASKAEPSERITRDGNPEGPLFGEVVVFTGALALPRREAADLAASAGCEVAQSVTKTTTLLVIGDQDVRKLGGHEQSAKHRRAEELIAKGQSIRILGESGFQSLVREAQ